MEDHNDENKPLGDDSQLVEDQESSYEEEIVSEDHVHEDVPAEEVPHEEMHTHSEAIGDNEVADIPGDVDPADLARSNRRLMIPIIFKQFVICIVLILAAVIPISHQSTQMFSRNSTDRARAANFDQASTRSIALEREIDNMMAKTKLLSSVILEELKKPPSQQTEEAQEQIDHIFQQLDGLVSLEILSKETGVIESKKRLIDLEYLKQFKLNEDYISHIRDQINFPLEAIFSSTAENPVIEIRNSSTENGVPLVTVGFPYAIDEFGTTTHITVAEYRMDILQKAFANDDRMIFAIDDSRTILVHPDDNLVLARKKVDGSEIVEKSLNSQLRAGDTTFQFDGETYIGAYAKTPFGITVISQAAESVILEDARLIQHEAIGIAAMVLSIALFFIAVFAMTLTSPIEKLEKFAREIASGNFEAKSEVTSRDEVERLSDQMNEMVQGLIERDKAKNLINKFHGAVGEQLLKDGDVGRRGSKKDVTVFFSDIRAFTAFSEGHTPEEVVSMLNEYFQVMVEIINRNNGVVDKFIGDAIMAVWGVMSDENDAEKAVRACVEMRVALAELNKSRAERGLNEILIGAGLHSGEAIAGTIGSDERMEYTVIGDTVNMAARIEASTKAFGTDILVSETLQSQIKDKFWIEQAGTVEVKGKSEPLKLFNVKGYIKDGEQIEVATDYSSYDKGKDAKVKVA